MMLAHHHRADIHRCFLLPFPWGQIRVAVCARCLGFYPALFLALVVQSMAGVEPIHHLDWWLVFLGQAPLLVNWAAGRLSNERGSNVNRVLTGIVGGVAFSRACYLYFRDTGSELFWIDVVFIVIVVVAVEAVRSLRLKDLG